MMEADRRAVVIDAHVDDVLRHLAAPDRHPEGPACPPREDVVVEPPGRVAWREPGGVAVEYALEPVWTSTRATRTETAPGGARALRAVRAARRGRAAQRRLRALRLALEGRAARRSARW
jgi:hypothetical protein